MNNIFNHFVSNKHFYVKVYLSGMALQTISSMLFGGYILRHKFLNNNLTEYEKSIIKTKNEAFMLGMVKNIVIKDVFLWPFHIFDILKIFNLAGLIILSK